MGQSGRAYFQVGSEKITVNFSSLTDLEDQIDVLVEQRWPVIPVCSEIIIFDAEAQMVAA